MSGKSRTQPAAITPPTAEETKVSKALTGLLTETFVPQAAIAAGPLGASSFIRSIEQLEGGIRSFGEQRGGEVASSRNIADVALGQELESLQRLGGPSEAQRTLIEENIQGQFAAGTADIERFAGEQRRQIREEFAPASGLRPSDTPVTERAFSVGEEAVRQAGQLQSQLRAQGAQQLLQLPFAETQRRAGILGRAQETQQFREQTLQDRELFQQGIRQRSFENRLRLGLAPFAPGAAITAQLQAPRLRTASDRPGQTQAEAFSQTLGTVGQVAGAVGSTAAFFSTKAIKTTFGPVDAKLILDAMKELHVDRWVYKGDEDTAEHIGPYAEDFAQAFGVGDGETISIIDALGVLFVAVGELARREETHAS